MAARIVWKRQAGTTGAAPQATQDLASGHHNAQTYSAWRQASATLTYSAQPSAADTITIGTQTYTFVASGAVGNQVNIGGALTNTLDNLVAVITANTVTSALLTAVKTSGTVVTLTAKASVDQATNGNNIALSKVSANLTLSGNALTGGVAGDYQVVLDNAETVGINGPSGSGPGNSLGAVTLNAGEEGQTKTIYFYTKNTNNVVVNSVDGYISAGSVYTAATFAATQYFMTLKWMGGYWVVIASNGVTFA